MDSDVRQAPEWMDDENPEITPEEMCQARPARDREQWERLLAYGQARMREKLKAEGLDPDSMTEENIDEYINYAIHEVRQEQRKRG